MEQLHKAGCNRARIVVSTSLSDDIVTVTHLCFWTGWAKCSKDANSRAEACAKRKG